jgi:phosphoglycerate kinase
MAYLRLQDLDISGKRVLIREDLNVPIKNGTIANDSRLRAALPTLELALEQAEQVIVMSHLGRPEEGKPISEQPELSMRPVMDYLQAALTNRFPTLSTALCTDYLTNANAIADTGARLVILENVRVNPGEGADAEDLARAYASLCDVFVMDAFGTAHRAQASTHGVARFAPVACAGPLLAGELDALAQALEQPARPLLAIVGGAKVSSKLQVLQSLSQKVDQLIVGGGIANTFLKASGANIGKSLCEDELVDVAAKLMQETSIPLPTDVRVAKEFSSDARAVIKPVGDIEDDDMILDIGPETATGFANLIAQMKTIIWNGPVGVFEFPEFAAGTKAIAEAVASNDGFSIAGGGETVSAVDQFQVTDRISYISTGGGAFLEYVQGDELPAVKVLMERGS